YSSLIHCDYTHRTCSARICASCQRHAPGVVGVYPIGVAARLEPFVAARALLDLCGTLLAGVFVTLECIGNTIGLDPLQRACQYGGILKCLACPLSHERHHWMTSVAK